MLLPDIIRILPTPRSMNFLPRASMDFFMSASHTAFEERKKSNSVSYQVHCTAKLNCTELGYSEHAGIAIGFS